MARGCDARNLASSSRRENYSITGSGLRNSMESWFFCALPPTPKQVRKE